MITRGTIIAALLVIELAIIGEAAVAIHGGQPTPSFAQATDSRMSFGPRLMEGGPHKLFDAGVHPALNVDIGYADLTIVTSKAAQIDVSVSASTAFGIFRATAPITALADGATVRIAKTEGHGWSMGDDRMVTVVVPAGTKVTVANAGDIKANGLQAEASFTSVGDGSVRIEDYNAPTLHVESSRGRIVLRQIVAARLDVTTSDGRVEGTALQVRDGNIESDGRVTLGFAAGSDTLVTADTNNGRVIVSGFPAAASVTTTHKSGEDSDDDSSSKTVRVGAGTGRLDVHSDDGTIHLDQEG